MSARPSELRPSELRLESSRGGSRAPFATGRVVVAFYEPRDRLEDNAALKEALRERAAGNGRFDVVAIGDVSSFDFDPVRAIVRRVVRTLGARSDLEILLDWKGALAAPPFSLTRGDTNVLVIDGAGTIVRRVRGVVRPADVDAFSDEIVALSG